MTQERFQSIIDKVIPSSNTRGQLGAPADSGQERKIPTEEILSQSVEDIRAGFDLGGPEFLQGRQLIRQELAQDRPKNLLDRTILRGGNWGQTQLPGGIPFVNPLKTLFSGLDWVMTNIADPGSGYLVGNTSVLLDRVTNWSSAGKIAQEFKSKLELEEGSFLSPVSAFSQQRNLKEFQESRQNLFIGEKFFTSLAMDPLTYVGFGIAGRLPMIGKVLGPIESGYVGAFNFPFKVATRAYAGGLRLPNYIPLLGGKQLAPKSRRQLVGQRGDDVFNETTEAIVEAGGGGKAAELVTKEEFRPVVTEALDVTIHYNSLSSNAVRKLRDNLLATPDLDNAQAQVVLNRIAGGKASTIIRPDVVEDAGIRGAISELREHVVKGRLQVNEAADQMVRTMGFVTDEKTLTRASEWLQGEADRIIRNAQLLSDFTPTQYRDFLRSFNSKVFRRNLENDTLARRQLTGGWQALVGDKLDGFQNTLAQSKLRKWVIDTPARLVLTFPLFPVQERMETVARQMLGRSSIGMMKPGEFSTLISHYPTAGLPVSLTREGLELAVEKAAVTRGGFVAPTEDTLFDKLSSSLIKNFGVDDVDVKNRKGLWGKALFWANPDNWLRAAQESSANGRRHYIVDRARIRMTGSILDEMPDVANAIDFDRGILDKGVAKRLQTDLTLTAYSGKPEAVRGLAGTFSTDNIDKIEFEKVIEKWAGSTEIHSTSTDLMTTWLNAGAKGSIDDLTQQVIDNELDVFIRGVGGMNTAMEIANGQINSFTDEIVAKLGKGVKLTDDDISTATYAIGDSHRMMEALAHRVSQVSQAATVEARSAIRNAKGKRTIFEKANTEIDKLVASVNKQMDDYTDVIRRLEESAFGSSQGFADNFRSEWDALSNGWNTHIANRKTRFEAVNEINRNNLPGHFWDELHEESDQLWTTINNTLGEIRANRLTLHNQILAQRGITVKAVKKVDFAKKYPTRLGLRGVSEALGIQSENVTQAIFAGAFHNKQDFVDHVRRTAQRAGHSNLDLKKVSAAYDEILALTGFRQSATTSFFQQHTSRLNRMKQELVNTKRAPKFTPQHEQYARDQIERVAKSLESLPIEERARIANSGNKHMQSAVEDMKLAFVNYDDASVLDDTMRSIYPFWTYQARRMPFLLRSSFTNPVVWNTWGPEGRYWDNTDDGYINAPVPGMQFNPFGGTLLNAPRRLKKGDMPAEYEGGVRGAISGFEQQSSQLGFYWGTHMNFAVDALATGDVYQAIGDSTVPPITMGFSGMQWLAEQMQLPVLDTELAKMRLTVAPDRFVEYDIMKTIWDMGFNPADVDPETWTPRQGAKLTQEDIQEAMHRAAGIEFFKEVTGILRFRPEAEQDYRAAKDKIAMAWTGLNQEELDEARRQKIPLTSITPMHPVVGRMLNELEGGEEFSSSTALLATGERERIEGLTREMWDQYQTRRAETELEQQREDDLWFGGVLSPAEWRDQSTNRKISMGGMLNSMRGVKRVGNPEEAVRFGAPIGTLVDVDPDARYREVPTTYEDYVELQTKLGNNTIRLNHPVDQAIQDYFEIAPRDEDGDGTPDFNQFFKDRDAVLSRLPAEIRQEVLDEIDRRASEPERKLRQLQRGVLGEYWDVDDVVAEELGIEDMLRSLRIAQFRDPETAAVLRNLPVMKRFRTEVQRRKDAMRLESPELDYGLNIFGFTGRTLKFKNETAKQWWRQGDGVNSGVPWLGYFEGLQPPRGGN